MKIDETEAVVTALAIKIIIFREDSLKQHKKLIQDFH